MSRRARHISGWWTALGTIGAYGRLLPLLFLFLILSQTVNAQPAKDLSPSVVLVLKLVSKTHVRPVTGMVISDDGLVLVPAEFVSTDTPGADSEILVLDGGTDIVSHGRPATVINRSMRYGLAVLSVEGLTRPAFTLSEDVFGSQSDLHLQAFPPAEYIAKGADPLWIPLSSEQALPYVSGPIIDRCGFLTGFSLASGAQSLDVDTAPKTLTAPELKQAILEMRLDVRSASCAAARQQTIASTGARDDTPVPAVTSEPGEQTTNPDENAVAVTQAGDSELRADSTKVVVTSQNRPVTTGIPEKSSIWRSVPWWLLLLGFIALGLSAWKTYLYYRLHRHSMTEGQAGHSMIQPASDEPATAPLGEGSGATTVKPRSGQRDDVEIPDANSLPEGYDSVLVIEGLSGSEIIFKDFCIVNTQASGVVIGRGEADIKIEHPAVSRIHASLELSQGVMTLSDSGSNNGTYINGIPCLAGEVFYIKCEDDLCLGDVRIRLSLNKKEADFS